MKTYHAGGVSFAVAPIMIGAGVCKDPVRTREWLTVAPVVSGSYTQDKRSGNEGLRLFHPDLLEEFLEQGWGLNSFGMPNMSILNGLEHLDRYEGENPLFVSVAGFSTDEYIGGVRAVSATSMITACELNFGCPNTDHGKIMSFRPQALEDLFAQLDHNVVKKPIWVKLSPYSDPGLLKEVAEAVNTVPSVVKAVVTCNTFPNAYAGPDAISPMSGFAGLSGPALKPIALGQVVQFRKHLLDEIDVIGVGGITTGDDVIDFLDAGASAVQLTSLPFWLGNPGHFWGMLLDPDNGGGRLEERLAA